MAESRACGVNRLNRRRWSFGNCVFDEANWSLTVDDVRVPVESKPLELLRELLLHPNQVVTKTELLDTIWPQVTVVEASLPTAVRKLRLALGCDERDTPIIETVSGIGYRFAIPVEVTEFGPARGAAASPPASPMRRFALGGRARWVALSVMAALVAALAMMQPREQPGLGYAKLSTAQRDQISAMRRLDVAAVERLIADGWDVNRPYDEEGNGALNMLLNNCEWDPGHDQRRMLLVARTLIDADAKLDRRNVWGDTPYSIASADRYCGPDHPVSRMILTMCYAGFHRPGRLCLADYKRDAAGKVVRQELKWASRAP